MRGRKTLFLTNLPILKILGVGGGGGGHVPHDPFCSKVPDSAAKLHRITYEHGCTIHVDYEQSPVFLFSEKKSRKPARGNCYFADQTVT